MTTKEVREFIAESEFTEFFNSIQIEINYPHIDFFQSFKGLSSIHKFLLDQVKGWKKYESLPSQLERSKEHFIALLARLEGFIIDIIQVDYVALIEKNWMQEAVHLRKHEQLFIFDSPTTQFLIQLNQEYPDNFPGAYNFLVGLHSHNLNKQENYIGSLMAYDFRYKDHSDFIQRQEDGPSSIRQIDEKLRNHLSEIETHVSEHLSKSAKEYKEHVEMMTGLRVEKEALFNKWFSTSKEDLGTFNEASKNKIESLEKTYEEILRLKKPAEYWKKRALKLKNEGWTAIYWLIGMIVLTCTTLYFLLWLTPEGMMVSFKSNQSSAIKWSVIYITFLSFLAYGIRALNKIAFSSFHLARDAEEREQLTYVYLALIKESAISDNEKNLIMQSLFSRADTGLLKEDSSPSMPNDIMGKIFGK